MTKKSMTFTPFLAKEFKKAYLKAADEKAESFLFCDHKFQIGYAKYLVQHLELNIYKKPLEKLKNNEV